MKVDTTLSQGIVKMETHFIKNEVVSECSNLGQSKLGPMGALEHDGVTYGNLAESFDLSLLGDHYEDHDTALVPSPGNWMQVSGAMDPVYWQQMSLYEGSPGSGDCYLPYSPDTKPVHSPQLRGQGSTDSQGNNRNFLLRQCLEDTTFQKKCNFKPVDIAFNRDSEGFGSTNENCGPMMPKPTNFQSNLEFNQIEPVFSLAFEQVRADIRKTCGALDISPDPLAWSSVDVQSWLAHTLSSLPRMTTTSVWTPLDVVLANFWTLDGQAIHAFSEGDFVRADPDNGDRLFANLELWKISAQMDAVKGDWENMLFENGPIPESHQGFNDLRLPTTTLRFPEDISSSGSSIGYSDGNSDTCSSVDARSPRPNFRTSPEVMQTDDDDEDDDEEEDVTKVVVGGTGPKKNPTKTGGAHIHLWQFLKELLASPQQHGSCIRWLDQSHGVFKIEDSVRVARLWGLRKNRPAMNYDKLSRSIRQYYRKGIMRKTERSQRLVYQFCHPYGL